MRSGLIVLFVLAITLGAVAGPKEDPKAARERKRLKVAERQLGSLKVSAGIIETAVPNAPARIDRAKLREILKRQAEAIAILMDEKKGRWRTGQSVIITNRVPKTKPEDVRKIRGRGVGRGRP